MEASSAEHLRSALHRSLEDLLNDGYKAIKPHHIVFHALENAMETLRKLPDREAAWLKSGGSWPAFVATSAGYARVDMETQLALILASILGENDDRVVRAAATRTEIAEMDAVFESFRTNLAGTRRRRDWKILCLLAAGKGQRFVARISEASHETVRQEKLSQSLALAKALADFMPPEPEGGYRLAA